MDTRSILGLQPLWPSFLDDLSAACAPQAEAGRRARVVINVDDEDLDDDPDDDDEDLDGDDESDDEDDEDDDEDEDVETWQVSDAMLYAKG